MESTKKIEITRHEACLARQALHLRALLMDNVHNLEYKGDNHENFELSSEVSQLATKFRNLVLDNDKENSWDKSEENKDFVFKTT
jgi:hypothetical protein